MHDATACTGPNETAMRNPSSISYSWLVLLAQAICWGCEESTGSQWALPAADNTQWGEGGCHQNKRDNGQLTNERVASNASSRMQAKRHAMQRETGLG